MAQQTDADERIELEVSEDDVIKAIKMDDTHGVDRSILFHKKYNGGYKAGQIEEYKGHRTWDGEGPVIINPLDFVDDFVAESPSKAKRTARQEAKKEENADVEEWKEVALETWESNMRSGLKDEIVVRNYDGTVTVYEITYTEE